MVAPINFSALEAEAVRTSPGAWWELYGAIYDKERNVLCSRTADSREKRLRLNHMQQQLDEILRYCEEYGIPCRIITLKGRQQGSSTWSVGGLYHMLRKKNAKGCIIGDQYERSVANLVAMFDLYADADLFRWGNDYRAPSKSFSHGSMLVTETANSNRAGASGTLQAVLATEVAHWKESTGSGGGKISAKAVFAALLNCVPKKPGTLVIVESTPNGASGVYYDTYQNAATFEQIKSGQTPENWNGFIKVFYPWHQHPEYCVKDISPQQAEDVMSTLSEREHELIAENKATPGQLLWRREKLAGPEFNHDEAKFEEEYPADEQRCFLMSGRRAFPNTQLMNMRKRAEEFGPGMLKTGVLQWTDNTEKAAVFRGTGEEEAWVKIWELPRPGLRYLLVVDPCTGAAHGPDPDNHGIGMWRAGYTHNGRWNPPAQVARLADVMAERLHPKKRAVCLWDTMIAEERVARLAAYYGWATTVVETNKDPGFVMLARNRSRMNLYVRIIPNRREQTEASEWGWDTNTKTRSRIIENLKAHIRHWDKDGEGMMLWDAAVINEHMTMILLDNGRAEAAGGCHDDQVLQAAIAMECIESAKVFPHPQVMLGDQNNQPRDMTYS